MKPFYISVFLVVLPLIVQCEDETLDMAISNLNKKIISRDVDLLAEEDKIEPVTVEEKPSDSSVPEDKTEKTKPLPPSSLDKATKKRLFQKYQKELAKYRTTPKISKLDQEVELGFMVPPQVKAPVNKFGKIPYQIPFYSVYRDQGESLQPPIRDIPVLPFKQIRYASLEEIPSHQTKIISNPVVKQESFVIRERSKNKSGQDLPGIRIPSAIELISQFIQMLEKEEFQSPNSRSQPQSPYQNLPNVLYPPSFPSDPSPIYSDSISSKNQEPVIPFSIKMVEIPSKSKYSVPQYIPKQREPWIPSSHSQTPLPSYKKIVMVEPEHDSSYKIVSEGREGEILLPPAEDAKMSFLNEKNSPHNSLTIFNPKQPSFPFLPFRIPEGAIPIQISASLPTHREVTPTKNNAAASPIVFSSYAPRYTPARTENPNNFLVEAMKIIQSFPKIHQDKVESSQRLVKSPIQIVDAVNEAPISFPIRKHASREEPVIFIMKQDPSLEKIDNLPLRAFSFPSNYRNDGSLVEIGLEEINSSY